MIETRFTRDYGVRHPIAFAPMAFVGMPELAIAACRAGCVGALAVGPLPPDAVRGLIRAIKRATDGPLNVNFITFLSEATQIQACIDEGVSIVSFHWGCLQREFIQRLHDAGIKVWEQVDPSMWQRRLLTRALTSSLLKAVKPAVTITDRCRRLFWFLPLLRPSLRRRCWPRAASLTDDSLPPRSCSAQTAHRSARGFVASDEAFAHPEYKRRLIEADGTRTRLTSIYGPDLPQFNPMRVLDTGLARAFAGREDAAPKSLESQPVIAKMRLAGEEIPLHRFASFVPTPDTEGDIEELPLLAGQSVGLIREVKPVTQIIDTRMTEALLALSAIQR